MSKLWRRKAPWANDLLKGRISHKAYYYIYHTHPPQGLLLFPSLNTLSFLKPQSSLYFLSCSFVPSEYTYLLPWTAGTMNSFDIEAPCVSSVKTAINSILAITDMKCQLDGNLKSYLEHLSPEERDRLKYFTLSLMVYFDESQNPTSTQDINDGSNEPGEPTHCEIIGLVSPAVSTISREIHCTQNSRDHDVMDRRTCLRSNTALPDSKDAVEDMYVATPSPIWTIDAGDVKEDTETGGIGDILSVPDPALPRPILQSSRSGTEMEASDCLSGSTCRARTPTTSPSPSIPDNRHSSPNQKPSQPDDCDSYIIEVNHPPRHPEPQTPIPPIPRSDMGVEEATACQPPSACRASTPAASLTPSPSGTNSVLPKKASSQPGVDGPDDEKQTLSAAEELIAQSTKDFVVMSYEHVRILGSSQNSAKTYKILFDSLEGSQNTTTPAWSDGSQWVSLVEGGHSERSKSSLYYALTAVAFARWHSVQTGFIKGKSQQDATKEVSSRILGPKPEYGHPENIRWEQRRKNLGTHLTRGRKWSRLADSFGFGILLTRIW